MWATTGYGVGMSPGIQLESGIYSSIDAFRGNATEVCANISAVQLCYSWNKFGEGGAVAFSPLDALIPFGYDIAKTHTTVVTLGKLGAGFNVCAGHP